jgi:hypothetical protein
MAIINITNIFKKGIFLDNKFSSRRICNGAA